MIFGPGMVFSPFAQVRGDAFLRRNGTEDEYETVTHCARLGLGGAEISWPFMRPGERFDMIVEPVRRWGPSRPTRPDDPRIVNEDSLAFELDDSNLFRPNAAPNYDLWEPGGRVSARRARHGAGAHGQRLTSCWARWRDEQADGFTEENNLGGEAPTGSPPARSIWARFRHRSAGSPRKRNLEVERIDLGVRRRR